MKQTNNYKIIINHLIILAVIFVLFMVLIMVSICFYYKFSLDYFRSLLFDESYNDYLINFFRKLFFNSSLGRLKIWVLCEDVFRIHQYQLDLSEEVCKLDAEKLLQPNDIVKNQQLIQIQQAKMADLKSKNDAETLALRKLVRTFAILYDEQLDKIIETNRPKNK